VQVGHVAVNDGPVEEGNLVVVLAGDKQVVFENRKGIPAELFFLWKSFVTYYRFVS